MRFPILFLVVSSLGFASSGCFVLERAATLEPGSVVGTATIAGDGVDNVNVVLVNSPLLQRSTAAGDFVFADLPAGAHALRLLRDNDNDGVVERGAVASFAITSSAGRLSGVDLGPIELRGTVGVSGVVTDLDGGGLDGVQVVVTRFTVDHTAEQILPLVDDDGDGTVAFTLTGVVPGTVELFAFANGGRASAATVVVVGDAPVDDLTLGVAAAPAVSVTTQVTPPRPETRFVVVPVGASLQAEPVATAAVGQLVSLSAGVYDVWFLDDDSVPIAHLGQQVARPGEGDLAWGPALRGAALAEGEGEGEGEGESFHISNALPLLIHPDGTPSAAMVVTATNADGTPAVLSVDPTSLPIAVDFDPATGTLSAHFDDSRGVAADDVLLAHEDLRVRTELGRVYSLPTAYIAHAAYTGAVAHDRTQAGSWLSSRFPESNNDSIVVLGPLDAAGDLNFGAIDIVVTEGGGGGSIVLSDGRLTVSRVLNSRGEALILGPGNVTVDGELRGRIQDASVTIDGTTTLSSLNILGTGDITVSEGARVQITGDSGDVYLQVPFTLSTGAVFAIDNGFPHFTANVTATDSVFEVGANGGVAFGFFDDVERSFTVSIVGDVRTASFAGSATRVTVVGALTASTALKTAGGVAVDVDDVFAGALALDSATPLNGNVSITGDGTTTSHGTLLGQLNVNTTMTLEVGDVVEAGAVVVRDGAELDLSLGGTLRATTVQNTGTITFGNSAATLSTTQLSQEGFLDLGGAGTLELTGVGVVFSMATGSIFSAAPRNHRLVIDNGLGVATTLSAPGDTAFDDLVVGAQAFASDNTISVDAITIDDGGSLQGDIVFASCAGGGCPPPA